MNTAPNKHTKAKRNIHPCMPSTTVKNGRNFVTKNANVDKTAMQTRLPKSFSFSGNVSAITKNVSDVRPQLARNIVYEKLVTGSQLRSLKS